MTNTESNHPLVSFITLLLFALLLFAILANSATKENDISSPVPDEKLRMSALSFEKLICGFKNHRDELGRADDPWTPAIDYTPNVLSHRLSDLTKVLGRKEEHREELRTMMTSLTVTPKDWCRYANELARKYSTETNRSAPGREKLLKFLPQLEDEYEENV